VNAFGIVQPYHDSGGGIIEHSVQPEEAIRVVFANSSDTLPMGLDIAKESIESMVQ
jgi:hypothetical protein